jgi:hypothetical protein
MLKFTSSPKQLGDCWRANPSMPHDRYMHYVLVTNCLCNARFSVIFTTQKDKDHIMNVLFTMPTAASHCAFIARRLAK